MTRASLEQFAGDAGTPDVDAFSDCLDSGRYTDIVRNSHNLARSVGLDATPSFIALIDGETAQLMRGAHPYSTFERVINDPYTS